MRITMLYVPPAPFRRLWASETARVFAGQWMYIVLPWVYLHMVHSPEWYGFLMTLTSIPRVLGSAFAAWLNRRWPAVSVMRMASFTAAFGAVGLVACFALSVPWLWALMPFVLVMAFTEGVYFPAIGTAVPQLLPQSSWQQANTLLQSTNQIARMLISFVLSPVVARVSHWMSFSWVAALYLFTSAVLPRAKRIVQVPKKGVSTSEPAGTAHETASDAPSSEAEDDDSAFGTRRTFWRQPAFLILLSLTIGINLGYLGPTGVGIPLFVRAALHGIASTYALMVGCEAAGSLAGMFLLMVTHRFRLGVHVLLYGLYVGTLFWLFIPLVPRVAWVAVFMALSMMAFIWVNIQSISLIQAWFHGPSLGAVMSVLWTASMVLGPVSYAMDGALLKWLPIQTLFIASACFIGLVVTITLVCVWVRPHWVPNRPTSAQASSQG